jgi:hypothetical protein
VTESFVLVHAPVLGPASWAPVATELARNGHRVTVPALTGFADEGPPYVDRLIDLARGQIGGLPASGVGGQIGGAPASGVGGQIGGPQVGRVILVVHSGAGVFAPYLAEAAAADAVIFADASLPPSARHPSAEDPSARHPSAEDPSRPDGEDRVIDAKFLPFLRDIAAGGIVPPWPRWWPAEELALLYPDEVTRASVDAEAAPLPLAFFEEHLPPSPASWPTRQPGYLQFSEGYGDTAGQAGALGWPVRRLPGEHLHMLVDPVGVAAALTTLAAALITPGRRPH